MPFQYFQFPTKPIRFAKVQWSCGVAYQMQWPDFFFHILKAKQLERITTLSMCRQSPLNLHQFLLTRNSKYGFVGTDWNAICLYFASIWLYLALLFTMSIIKLWKNSGHFVSNFCIPGLEAQQLVFQHSPPTNQRAVSTEKSFINKN